MDAALQDDELLERTPLLTPEGARLLQRLREHPDAPRWNYAVGDRLVGEDLPALDDYREQLATRRGPRDHGPPVPYSCRDGRGFHLLPHDLHVETVRADGSPTMPGVRGEIMVTGGRNPYLPLLRYRTGDWARIETDPCSCGDPMPRLLDFEGRTPILFRASDDTPVGTVDISRLLREFPLLQHSFTQHADRSCELVLRPVPDQSPAAADIERALRTLLGALPLEVRVDPHLGDHDEGKVVPYQSAIRLGD